MKRDYILFLFCLILSIISVILIIYVGYCPKINSTKKEIALCIFGGIFGSSFVLFLNKLADFFQSKKEYFIDLYELAYKFYREVKTLRPVYVSNPITNNELGFALIENAYKNLTIDNYIEILPKRRREGMFFCRKNKKKLTVLFRFLENELKVILHNKNLIMYGDYDGQLKYLLQSNNRYLFEKLHHSNDILIYSRMENGFLEILNWLYKKAYDADKKHTMFFIQKFQKDCDNILIGFDTEKQFDPYNCEQTTNFNMTNLYEYYSVKSETEKIEE